LSFSVLRLLRLTKYFHNLFAAGIYKGEKYNMANLPTG
jgi:hypothetical protein